MSFYKKLNFKEKVTKYTNDTLDQSGSVNLLFILSKMNWLNSQQLQKWQQGLYPNLEGFFQSTPQKRLEVYKIFQAETSGLTFIEAPWTFHSLLNENIKLKVLSEENEDVETLFCRHFLSKDISTRKTETLRKKLTQKPDLRVFLHEDKKALECNACHAIVEKENFFYSELKKTYCLKCAELDKLAFQESGDATLSRRAKKYSQKFAEVVEFNSKKKRFERRGILVDKKAIELAQVSCSQDATERATKRIKSSEKRVQDDFDFTQEFTKSVASLFPLCPEGEVSAIAEHATVRGSGRVGRRAAAKKLDDESIRLAVIAYIRHKHTFYDRLLLNRTPKKTCRKLVQPVIEKKLKSWETK